MGLSFAQPAVVALHGLIVTILTCKYWGNSMCHRFLLLLGLLPQEKREPGLKHLRNGFKLMSFLLKPYCAVNANSRGPKNCAKSSMEEASLSASILAHVAPGTDHED